jgi:MFS family permease
VAGADIRRFSSDRRGVRVNTLLGTGVAGLSALADTLILPSIVLAFFAGQMTRSYVVIGLVAAIASGVWALSRLPAAMLVAPQRRKQPWALAAAIVRAAALGLLAFVVYRIPPGGLAGNEGTLLRSFLICFVAYAIANGFASVPTEALIAKSVPNTSRAQFYRQRALLGAVLSVLGALVVVQLFRESGPATPRQFALIFLTAAVCQLAIAIFIASVREPLRVAEGRQGAPLAAFQALPQALADGDYRRFIFFRVLLSLTAIVDPFLVLFAVTRLGLSPATVGAYVLTYVLGILMSPPAWAALAHKAGERACLQVAAFFRLLPPLLALVLPYLASSQFFQERLAGTRVVEIAFGAAFWFIGAATAGQARANFGYLAEFAPTRLRGAYASVTNGILAIVAFSPIAGGLLIERGGYDLLFLVAAVIGLLAVFASGAMTDAFVRASSATSAMRLRRESGPPPPVASAVAAFPGDLPR